MSRLDFPDTRERLLLPWLAVTAGPAAPARISVIIPARNEARGIARCLDGALSQPESDGVAEVIVVDDDSSDDTPRILADYQQRLPERARLRVIAGRPLPPGWAGKCNACMHGAEHATGDWLLFLDADTIARPGLARALLGHARLRTLDMLSIMPFNELGSLSERVVMPIFFQFLSVAFPPRRLRDPQMPPEFALANGQCIFVRRDAYWSIGGHAAVRDRVLEDAALARAMRASGRRLGLARGRDQLAVRMYHNFGEIAEGLGKHAMAGQRHAGGRAWLAAAHLVLTAVAPPLLVLCAVIGVCFTSGALALPALLASLGAYGASLVFWRRHIRENFDAPGWMALLAPAGMLAYSCIVMLAMLRSMTGAGVRWKGRVYAS